MAQRRVAEAMYATASLLNHSCCPNTVLNYEGRMLTIRYCSIRLRKQFSNLIWCFHAERAKIYQGGGRYSTVMDLTLPICPHRKSDVKRCVISTFSPAAVKPAQGTLISSWEALVLTCEGLLVH